MVLHWKVSKVASGSAADSSQTWMNCLSGRLEGTMYDLVGRVNGAALQLGMRINVQGKTEVVKVCDDWIFR